MRVFGIFLSDGILNGKSGLQVLDLPIAPEMPRGSGIALQTNTLSEGIAHQTRCNGSDLCVHSSPKETLKGGKVYCLSD